MKPISKIALPVVAMAAALISSCGGSGESQDYYISVQQFENGSKAFRFIGSPSVDVYGSGTFAGDHKVSLKQGFVDQMTTAVQTDGNDGDFKQSVIDEGEKVVATADGGTIVNGQVASSGDTDPSQIAYYVSGGETGKGYLFITFQSSLGAPTAVVHLMGCITPQDVIPLTRGGVTGNEMVQINQAIVASLKGCVVRATVDFSTGMAQLGLAFQVWEKDEDSGSGDSATYSSTGEWKNVVNSTVPFIAVSR